MNKFLLITLIVALGLILTGIVIYGIAWLLTPSSQIARALVWLESDVEDYKRFPYCEVQPGDEPFYFDKPVVAGYYSDLFNTEYLDPDQFPNQGSFDALLEDNGTTAFLVIKDDLLIYENYFNGYSADSIQTSFSAAKSFVSALVGIAIDEGYIDSVYDPITKYIPELLERDERFGEITIQNMISMSSGIQYVEHGLPWSDDATTYYNPDLQSAALTRTVIQEKPGTKFLYNNYNPLLSGILLERATGESVCDYFESRLWSQIGMQAPGSWSLDSEATRFAKMESGINGRAIDFAKFGRLFLNNGNWQGKQVISAGWVDESTRADTVTDPVWHYQYYWWVSTSDSPEHHYEIKNGELVDYADVDPLPDARYHYSAAGNYGQYIFVVPEQELIFVRFGTEYGDIDWFYFFEILAQRLEAM